MPKIRKIEPKTALLKPKKRVAAYARVSRDSERLMHSLSAQVSYYSALIQKNPDWEYAGVYADEGITGTIAGKRDTFQELLADCDAGKIDLILVKSISRFARNTVDLLEAVRHLKDIRVEVYFEKEHISSLSGDGELMMTLLASFAQEESRSMSENIRWAFQKMYQKGKPHYRFRILGYDWDKDRMVINKNEARIVRRIYTEYLAGEKLEDIADRLYADGCLSINGKKIVPPQLYKILTNITYTGNLLCQKTFITDPITKVSKKNEGELPQYYIADSHEPIISMEEFEAVKVEMERRHIFFGEWRNNSNYGDYALSGKIKCGCCGKSFNRKIRQENKGGKRTVYWACRSVLQVEGCPNRKSLPMSELSKILCELLGMDTWDEQTVADGIDKIVVPEYGRLIFYLKSGDVIERTWVSNARSDSWDDARRQNQIQKMHEYHASKTIFGDMIICGCCGNPIRKYTEKNRGKMVSYWKCINKEGTCKQRGIREDFLKNTLSEVLEFEEFDIAKLKKTVERMTFGANRRFTIVTKDGRTINLKLGGMNNGYSYEDTCEAE